VFEIDIPGYRSLQLSHLVMDYNGTLAQDGRLLDGIWERLLSLSTQLDLHAVTADTFGTASSQLDGLPLELAILPGKEQAQAKMAYVKHLGAEQVLAIGNGRNDHLMLQSAALSVAVIQGEGAAMKTCLAADIVVPDILVALELLLFPERLVATLRG
jgi:soluble P-type ATPase